MYAWIIFRTLGYLYFLHKHHLGIKCHSQYIKVIRLDPSAQFLPIVNRGEWECIVHDLETIIVLSLTRIQFHPTEVTPLNNLAEI